MLNFNDFKVAVRQQFDKMTTHELFVTDVNKDVLWETYLNSFPEGTNPMFRERTEHDCQCCKHFIRACGNVVAIVDNKLVSVWDIAIGDHYQVVADALAGLVKSHLVKNVFRHDERKLGTDFNRQMLESGEVVTWSHFYLELPKEFVKRKNSIGSFLSKARSNKDVFKRGLVEISMEAAETVLELIEQNSIYRGEENKLAVESFLIYKAGFDLSTDEKEKDNYCWVHAANTGGAARVRNTMIGTLLVDISDGKELDDAVRLFESKVAPTNYKRPTAVITKNMIANAQKKVSELGIEESLHRRHAVVEDITVNNVLFADRSVKRSMGVFDELIKETPTNIKNFEKVDEVNIQTFIEDILPKVDSVEVLLENKHTNNLMSLIAPRDENAKRIFKWDNNFSWAYNGEVADSIKERVKKAGGNVNGVLRCSLSWFNYDDLDIHVIEPDGFHIYYSSRHSPRTTGKLDVDMNVSANESRKAVENIVWTDKHRMLEGVYRVFVHNYTPRDAVNLGFDVEIEFEKDIRTVYYRKRVSNKIDAVLFHFSRKDGIKIIESLPSALVSKKVWDLPTQDFHKVSMVMNSPNHWDGKMTGNKHYFFMIEDCRNDKPARGFFNEFLDEGLREHRKVFEILGSKMKTKKSDNQLSGLGFSSTQRNHVFCRVAGSFTRTLKIDF